MTLLKFIVESFKNLKQVGTITRTSDATCDRMLSHIDFSKVTSVVELGAGDGVITKHILNRLPEKSRLLVFELNDAFCTQLKEINDDRLIVVKDSAEHVTKYVEKYKFGPVDHIISSLPFLIIEDDAKSAILSQTKTLLKNSGKFVQINYSSKAKKIYQKYFSNIEVSRVVRNIPPAYVLACSNF